MILIVDSGSTKAHWRVLESNGKVSEFETVGYNPLHLQSNDFENSLRNEIPKQVPLLQVKSVFFYGAGCISDTVERKVKSLLSPFFKDASIQVNSDIVGAARSVFANSAGLVVILGTGTNVGYYNGVDIERKTMSLGYMLGDEGSGADLGKVVLTRWLYNDLSLDITERFNDFIGMTRQETITRMYSNQHAGKYFASFVPFIAQNIGHNDITSIVKGRFSCLVEHHLLKYNSFPTAQIGVVGSVGYMFRDILKDVLKDYGANNLSFIQYPIDGIVNYHREKKD
ncbi:MAG: hypothetical protein ACLFNU_05455 [Bacteroidales bacterium]